jgi:hypothetical protein
MPRRLNACTLALIWLCVRPVLAGPFGLDMGMTREQIERASGAPLEQITDGLYLATKLPDMHQDFPTYLLVLHPALGLCEIAAQGSGVFTPPTGEGLKALFNDVELQLKGIHGTNKKYDTTLGRNTPSVSTDWMQALFERERVLVAIWAAELQSTLKDNIQAVRLEARATGINTGYLALEYFFSNLPACQEASQARKTPL